jgi:ABC-2 type transport system permease protein
MRGILSYMERDYLKWTRGRVAVISALIMPAAWLIFVGLALPVRFTGNYLDFITPGILVMTMLTAGLSGGTLLMFDKILGFLNKFLALPTPREDILLGKIVFITGRGASLLSPLQYGLIYFVLFLFGMLISSFSTTIALYLDDHDSYAAFNTMISMPLFFTSSALMPYSVMPGWLATIAHLNPLSFAIDAVRDIGSGGLPVGPICLLGVIAVIVLGCSIAVFRKVTI